MATRPPIRLGSDRDPWDQQVGESPRQYERFTRYRDLGRMRSLTMLNRLLTECGDKLTYGTIRTQSYLYRWNDRSQLWDRHQDELDHERITTARRKMTERHIQIAGALTTKALRALRALPADDVDHADIVRMLKLATDLETRALGEPNQTISVTGPAGGPVQTEDLSNLTRAERQTRLQEVATEIARRAGLATIPHDAEDQL